jgi:protein-tyrosine phosphatase
MAPDFRWLVGSRHASRDLQVMHREHGSCMRRISMIDLSWITPELAIGACFLECEIESLAYEYKIRAVVDLRAESCDGELELSELGIELLHLPTLDHDAVAPEMLRAGVAFSVRHIDAGDRVLLHCQHGIGRSGLLGLCVLVELGYSPVRALELAKYKREKVSPSPMQYDAWAQWLTSRGKEAPPFDRFAEIAYRHLRS